MGKFTCVTSNKICPDLVDVETFGHHSSEPAPFGMLRPTRIWTFETEHARALFKLRVEQGDFRRNSN